MLFILKVVPASAAGEHSHCHDCQCVRCLHDNVDEYYSIRTYHNIQCTPHASTHADVISNVLHCCFISTEFYKVLGETFLLRFSLEERNILFYSSYRSEAAGKHFLESNVALSGRNSLGYFQFSWTVRRVCFGFFEDISFYAILRGIKAYSGL